MIGVYERGVPETPGVLWGPVAEDVGIGSIDGSQPLTRLQIAKQARSAANQELRASVRYLKKQLRSHPHTPSARRAVERLERARIMAKKAMVEEAVATAEETGTEVAGEVDMTPNSDCKRGHGAEEQRVTPKGVKYCRVCYKENRQARLDKQKDEEISGNGASGELVEA